MQCLSSFDLALPAAPGPRHAAELAIEVRERPAERDSSEAAESTAQGEAGAATTRLPKWGSTSLADDADVAVSPKVGGRDLS